eukprot:15450899-Alexandrium_andersonii.AAC.1
MGMCTRRGAKDQVVVAAAEKFLSSLGGERVRLRVDQETSLMDVATAIQKKHSKPIHIEATPKASKGSLGAVERMHGVLGGQIRTMKDAVEDSYELSMSPGHFLVPWLIRHS